MKRFGFLLLLSSVCHAHPHIDKPKVYDPIYVARVSPLPVADLACLKINNPADFTGYEFYQNVTFDPQLAVNPTNHKNMVMVLQHDVLTNAQYNGSATLAITVLYTFDEGKTWSNSNLFMSRCHGATVYEANDDFISAYFPSVTFDKDGNCYVLSSSYNLFTASHQTTVNMSEGNIVAKSIDGGVNWNQVSAAFRDDGTCHFLDFPQIQANPHRSNRVYIVSSDHTCLVSDRCGDSNANGNQNILFQRSIDAANTWSDPLIVASFPPVDSIACTPRPILNQLLVLPDDDNTLVISSVLQSLAPGQLDPAANDQILLWRSKDDGKTWKSYPIAKKVKHVMATDPDSFDPVLPVTALLIKDMAVNPCNGHLYVVYADSQFNPNGEAGCVIRVSKDGGKSWSRPQPINPKTVDVQTFLPSVAVAKDGTVGVLFYDFRHFSPGDNKLSTDVWLSVFDSDLTHHYGEVRLTKESFDTRLAIRGYNGVDPADCLFDYYLSSNISLEANENSFDATFVITNSICPEAKIASAPCDSFPLSIDTCNRQDVVFVHIDR